MHLKIAGQLANSADPDYAVSDLAVDFAQTCISKYLGLASVAQ